MADSWKMTFLDGREPGRRVVEVLLVEARDQPGGGGVILALRRSDVAAGLAVGMLREGGSLLRLHAPEQEATSASTRPGGRLLRRSYH